MGDNPNFKKFVKRLEGSHTGVQHAAKWLEGRGYQVSIPPTIVADSYENRMAYVDNGDLFIERLRIEVKTLSVTFTGRDDWPYKNKFIVCGKDSFDRATPRPYAYLIQSKDLKFMGVVLSASSKYWYVENKLDKDYPEEYRQDFYMCPMEHVSFCSI